MVPTNSRLQCRLHNPPLTEVILNPIPVAEAMAVERDEDTAVEKDVAMVEEMARAEEEEFTLMTPVNVIVQTPSHT